MGNIWLDVAAHVKTRRLELNLSQEALAVKSKVGSSTIGFLEGGTKDRYQPATLAAVSTALWGHGDAIERILRGEEPVPAKQGPQPLADLAREFRDLADKLIERLEEGEQTG